MKILIDTNILISALLYPKAKPAASIFFATENHDLVLTDYNIAELYRVVGEKFPTKLPDVDALLNKLSYELITAPLSAHTLIADPKDAPILNAAILHEVDIIISGDKHFLQMDMKHPKVLKATEFLAIFDKDGQFTASQ